MMLLRIIIFIIVRTNISYADQYEIMGSAEIDSDHNSKTNEYLLKFKQKNKEKKYSQEIELNIEEDYSKIENNLQKVKEMIDYEHNFKYFTSDSLFTNIYLRRKYDHFATSKDQNFTLLTLGMGKKIARKNYELEALLSVGQKRSSDLEYIYMPKISYEQKIDKLTFNTPHSLVKDVNNEILSNKFSFSYPLNKNLKLTYIFKFERSKDNLTTEISRNNKLALSIKF